jgi:hypothetical protein
MPFSYYARLSPRQKLIYQQSDAVPWVALPDAPALLPLVEALGLALADEDRKELEGACQRLADAIFAQLGVSRVRLRVLAARPSKSWGELHGLYDPTEGRDKIVITLWMRTARLKRVVAFRTFLRTFLHEIGHHLDYEYLSLADSFHTQGFYQRESSLLKQLVPTERGAVRKAEP